MTLDKTEGAETCLRRVSGVSQMVFGESHATEGVEASFEGSSDAF